VDQSKTVEVIMQLSPQSNLYLWPRVFVAVEKVNKKALLSQRRPRDAPNIPVL